MNLTSMPKVELHLHLEGSARLSTFREALHRHAGMDLPETPQWLEPDFRFGSFEEFRQLFRDYLTPWLSAPTGYGELIQDVVDLLISQNIRYAEVNFCPNVFKRVDAHPPDVLDLLHEGASRAAWEGTVVKWIAGLNREEGLEETAGWIKKLLPEPIVAGFDLHGNEPDWSPSMFTEVLAPVLDAGKKLKIHAGETVGPESIRAAVEVVGATQIGHGVTAVEDPAVVDLLRERGTVVEMCPTSNERLRNVPSYADHPILELESRGVTVTVNSDDSLFVGSTLTDEMFRLMAERGAMVDDLIRWTRNGLEVAILEEAERENILSDLQQWKDEARTWRI